MFSPSASGTHLSFISNSFLSKNELVEIPLSKRNFKYFFGDELPCLAQIGHSMSDLIQPYKSNLAALVKTHSSDVRFRLSHTLNGSIFCRFHFFDKILSHG